MLCFILVLYIYCKRFQEQDDSNQAKTVFEGRTLIWKILDGCLSDKKTSKFISNLTSCQLFRVMSEKFHHYWDQGTLKLLRELTMIWGMLKKTPASTETPCIWFAGFLSLSFSLLLIFMWEMCFSGRNQLLSGFSK